MFLPILYTPMTSLCIEEPYCEEVVNLTIKYRHSVSGYQGEDNLVLNEEDVKQERERSKVRVISMASTQRNISAIL